MTDSNSPTVTDIFELLNRWRHLPSYPLEGRLAPFFALFLRDVLRERFAEMDDTLIPEFPLRIGSLYNEKERRKLQPIPGRNQSYKVDYVLFDKEKRSAYLVELKTDLESKRPKQDEYLRKARNTDFNLLVRGVRKLAKASKSKRKYVHLLHQLFRGGLVSENDALKELYKKSFSQDQVVSGWTKSIKGLVFEKQEFSKTKVVFVQPTEHKSDKERSENCGFKFIYFDEVANIVQQQGNLGCLFAKYLRQWTDPAGSLYQRSLDRS